AARERRSAPGDRAGDSNSAGRRPGDRRGQGPRKISSDRRPDGSVRRRRDCASRIARPAARVAGVTGIVAAVALTAGFVTEVTGGRLTGPPSTVFSGVSIDSRTIAPGMLFVAIRGEKLDGHAFVDQAIQKGAAGVLVSTAVTQGGGAPVVQVLDTVAALQALGR